MPISLNQLYERPKHMRIFRGSPALSEFRVNKLLKLCRELNLPVTGIYAEFTHFAELSGKEIFEV